MCLLDNIGYNFQRCLTYTKTDINKKRCRIEPDRGPVFEYRTEDRVQAKKENCVSWSFTHAGTSEFVTLDHGGGRAELRSPPSTGQTSRPATDHQKVEPSRFCCRRVWGHGSADDYVPVKRREGL